MLRKKINIAFLYFNANRSVVGWDFLKSIIIGIVLHLRPPPPFLPSSPGGLRGCGQPVSEPPGRSPEVQGFFSPPVPLRPSIADTPRSITTRRTKARRCVGRLRHYGPLKIDYRDTYQSALFLILLPLLLLTIRS